MISFAMTVFLSAFLLFQIQPIIAKMILPWFGGSSSVWSTCLVFFPGRTPARLSVRPPAARVALARRQNLVHCVLLLLSLATLPVVADPAWKEAAFEHPTWNVLVVLASAVGMPYLLLSTTGPLMQAWYARSFNSMMPYRLYALSNLASMLALLSYPVLVEPFFRYASRPGPGRSAYASSSWPVWPAPGSRGKGVSSELERTTSSSPRRRRGRHGASVCCGSAWR
jgi:hypothetical protein